jgi:two-component system cell cycle response regulator DivK
VNRYPKEYQRLAGRPPADDDKPTPEASRVSKSSRPKITVLFVDDLEDIRLLYARYLSLRGLRVIPAADGIAALRAVGLERPDVIVIDLAMPRMDGWETIETLRTNPGTKGIPILVLSGKNARDSARAAGADSYLEKPCAPEQLLRELLRLLQDPGQGREDRDQ